MRGLSCVCQVDATSCGTPPRVKSGVCVCVCVCGVQQQGCSDVYSAICCTVGEESQSMRELCGALMWSLSGAPLCGDLLMCACVRHVYASLYVHHPTVVHGLYGNNTFFMQPQGMSCPACVSQRAFVNICCIGQHLLTCVFCDQKSTLRVDFFRITRKKTPFCTGACLAPSFLEAGVSARTDVTLYCFCHRTA